MLKKEDREFWKGTGVRAIVIFGFTFFSTLVALSTAGIHQIHIVAYSSFINSGVYFFIELMKYYKIQPDKKVCTTSQTKLYNFLI